MLSLLQLLTLLACTEDIGDPGVAPVGANVYHEGMWVARAETVAAGLADAEALYQDGALDEAQAMLYAVYTGSFEPELEPATRAHLDPRLSTELEYGFGVVRALMARPRAEGRISDAILALNKAVGAAAESLDSSKVTLGPN